MKKQFKRNRRAIKTRSIIRNQNTPRICVFRSLKHIYAQVISPCGKKVLAVASTLEKSIRSEIEYGGNKKAAEIIGKTIAKKCLDLGVKKVAFDRSGYKYHGRVKALAEAAREGGIQF